MTNKAKLPSILALILILFLSLSAVGASDNVTHVTNGTDSVIDNGLAISSANDNLNSNFDDSKLEITDSQDSDVIGEKVIDSDCSDVIDDNIIDSDGSDVTDSIQSDDLEISDLNILDDEIADKKSKESNIGSSIQSDIASEREPMAVSISEPIVIDGSTYSNYFDSNGLIKSGTLKDGDTIKIKSISDKVFTINRKLNIISDDGDTLSNCIIRLVEGSSGSVIDNLHIVNTQEKLNGYYLSGISIINSLNNVIRNSFINVSLHKTFAVMMSNANYNKIVNNTLISGLSSTIPMTASSYNEIRDNHIESECANMIYQSAYGSGDFMPIDGGLCSGNIIANNFLKSRNGTYNSYCYAIYLMQSASGSGGVIANNTIENAFYGIIAEAPNTLIFNNTISKIGGPAAIRTSGENIKIISNNVSTEYSDDRTFNEDGNVVAIMNGAKNAIIANNTLKSIGSDAIVNTANNVKIANNRIYAESANCINSSKSNVVIENNSLEAVNSTGILVSNSKLAENITIRDNVIVTDKSAIVLKGNVSYALVCDNIISNSSDLEAIGIYKFSNRNPIIPSHCAIYNNTINGEIVNLTDPSEIEREDSPSGDDSGSQSGDDTGYDEGSYSDYKINTTIVIVNDSLSKGSYLEVYLKDKNGNPVSGEKLILRLANQNYANLTDEEGKARFRINANVGNYAMNITYAGNDIYNPTKVSSNLNVMRERFVVRQDNFYDCFDENGYLKEEYEDYELVFEGNFNNKRIILKRPVYLNSNSAILYDSVIKIESSNVIVNGFTIINSNPGNAASNNRFAILLDHVKNVDLTNNNIQLNSFDNGYGIYLSESSNSNIVNNRISVKANALTFGIMLYDSNENLLSNNEVFVNGTDKPHIYDSSIKVDSSISVDDHEAEGMVIPEVYKTYGIILFGSSSNDIGYNRISATSGVDKYYTAIVESTNSIVGIDLYYESNYNRVHNNNVNVTAKDPYLYGMGVLGAETGKRDQVSRDNSFTDNAIYVSGTYYAAGIIAGYNSINTVMARNIISCIANNVSYGAILEGADGTVFSDNNVNCNARVNYLLEGYDSDNGQISNNHIDYGDKALVVRAVSLYNSNYNRVTGNSLPSLKPLIPRLVAEINRLQKNKGSGLEFSENDIVYDGQKMRIVKDGKEYNLLDLLGYEATSHADVVSPDNQLYEDIGGVGNVYENNVVRGETDVPSGGTVKSNSKKSSSKSTSKTKKSGKGNDSGGSNSNGKGDSNGNGIKMNGTGAYSQINGNSIYSNSTETEGSGVGTSSSDPVSESAAAYNLNVDEEPAAALRSLSLGGMNAPVLCIILLLIFACASELIKRSKREI